MLFVRTSVTEAEKKYNLAFRRCTGIMGRGQHPTVYTDKFWLTEIWASTPPLPHIIYVAPNFAGVISGIVQYWSISSNRAVFYSWTLECGYTTACACFECTERVLRYDWTLQWPVRISVSRQSARRLAVNTAVGSHKCHLWRLNGAFCGLHFTVLSFVAACNLSS